MAGAPVGALQVRLGANTANFEQGMRRAAATARATGQDIERSYVRMSERGVRAFSTLRVGILGIATALAGNVLFQQARGALEWAGSLSETARQIGVTVEQLQVLQVSAERNGASIEAMQRSLAILNRRLGEAKAGVPAAVQAFNQLHLDPNQFSSAGELLPVLFDRLNNVATSAERAAIGNRLLGRSYSELAVMVAEGSQGLETIRQELVRTGMITQEQADRADEAQDSLADMARVLRTELAGALVNCLPLIQSVAAALLGLATLALRAIGLISRLTGFGYAGTINNMVRDGAFAVAGRAILAEVQRRAPGAQRGSPAYNNAISAMARDPYWGPIARQLRTMRGDPPPGPAVEGAEHIDLSGGGGGRHQRDNSARDVHQFDTEQRRLQIDALRAQSENTQAIDDRNEIQGRIAGLENEQWLADLRFRQSQHEINGAQASRLIELKNQLIYQEALGRALEYNRHVQEQENELADRREAIAQERLRTDADMAETAQERRRIELELLRITYDARRNALNRTISESRDAHAVAMAELELSNLPGMQARERAQIFRNTRGPLESFMAELPDTAAKLNEALQNVATSGLQAISDGLVDVITGARKMKDVFRSVVTSIISDLLRIQLQRAIIGPLANALSGLFGGAGGLTNSGTQGLLTSLPGRAAGGPVLPGRMYVVGEKGPELLSMGGTGGHVIANDNIGGVGGDVHIHQTYTFQGVAITQQEFVQGLQIVQADTIRSIRQGGRRRP